jgi:hypothetical protein
VAQLWINVLQSVLRMRPSVKQVLILVWRLKGLVVSRVVMHSESVWLRPVLVVPAVRVNYEKDRSKNGAT